MVDEDLESGDVAGRDKFDPDRIDDDILALMFVSCHPVLSPESRVALTLRVVGGLSSDRPRVPRTRADVQARITRPKILITRVANLLVGPHP